MTTINLILSELRKKIVPFGVWCGVWLSFALMMAPAFNMFADQGEEIEKFIGMFEDGLLEAFNMGIDYFESIEKFAGGEFLTFFGMVGAIYAAFVGVNSIAGKIADKTITNVLTKDISRTKIYLSKTLVNTLYFGISSMAIALLSYLTFLLIVDQDKISFTFFIAAFFAYFVLHLFFATFSQGIGVFLEKPKAQALSAGVVVVFWFVNSFAVIDSFPRAIIYSSPFYYVNDSYLVENFAVDWSKLWILGVGIIIFVIVGTLGFRKKDIYV